MVDDMRPDYSDAMTALEQVLASKPADRQWVMVWELREFMEQRWGIIESSAWIAARLRERARLKGDVEHVLLRTPRGGLYGGWRISPRANHSKPQERDGSSWEQNAIMLAEVNARLLESVGVALRRAQVRGLDTDVRAIRRAAGFHALSDCPHGNPFCGRPGWSKCGPCHDDMSEERP